MRSIARAIPEPEKPVTLLTLTFTLHAPAVLILLAMPAWLQFLRQRPAATVR
jgi:Tfp pilus assembly protein FimT